ncbi:DNA-binding transcriptional regulator, GntR family [Collimonas sp. OK242]|jgi:DNA-binding GntR family transcriptional regulator|uniref:GntR family transcriptional regulator n=1 Tax=Collimonas sp. OK242 TaxID=1798195 RepID=UPI0008996360|nr:GntR family transcriptional regulator [Collimonas sp. OK242]SDY78953.1 DNA-binding transcriptional regulator, GntR family [Collimonas sp. OK242]
MTKTEKPSRPSPLQLDLANRLIQQITTGELPAGTHLTEEGLASQFDVSRTPVKAALRLVAEQELLEYHVNSGYFVSANATLGKAAEMVVDGVSGDTLYLRLIDDRANNLLPDTMTETDFLARYAVPRSLLRGTLVRMAADGLIEKRRGQGWNFSPAIGSPELMAESYKFRIMVECGGLLESGFKIDAVQLQNSRLAHEKLLRQGQAPAEHPSLAFSSLNAAFHEMLARFSNNRFVLQAVQQQNQLRRPSEHLALHRDPRRIDSCKEHLQIIQALESDNREWAAALMRHHLSIARY